MYCSNCGSSSKENGAFCPECGSPIFGDPCEPTAFCENDEPTPSAEVADTDDDYEVLLDKEDFIRTHISAPLVCRIISNVSFWAACALWSYVFVFFMDHIRFVFIMGPYLSLTIGWLFPSAAYDIWFDILFYTAFYTLYILPFIPTLKKAYTEYSLSSAIFASCWGVIPFIAYPLLFRNSDILPWLLMAEFCLLLHTLMQVALHRSYLHYLNEFEDDIIEEEYDDV